MIKGMKRGLLISRFWYVRLVDPRTIVLTGLTRDGLWWIENGEIRHPGPQPALQSERAGDAGAVERRGDRRVAAAVAVHGAAAHGPPPHPHKPKQTTPPPKKRQSIPHQTPGRARPPPSTGKKENHPDPTLPTPGEANHTKKKNGGTGNKESRGKTGKGGGEGGRTEDKTIAK